MAYTVCGLWRVNALTNEQYRLAVLGTNGGGLVAALQALKRQLPQLSNGPIPATRSPRRASGNVGDQLGANNADPVAIAQQQLGDVIANLNTHLNSSQHALHQGQTRAQSRHNAECVAQAARDVLTIHNQLIAHPRVTEGARNRFLDVFTWFADFFRLKCGAKTQGTWSQSATQKAVDSQFSGVFAAISQAKRDAAKVVRMPRADAAVELNHMARDTAPAVGASSSGQLPLAGGADAAAFSPPKGVAGCW